GFDGGCTVRFSPPRCPVAHGPDGSPYCHPIQRLARCLLVTETCCPRCERRQVFRCGRSFETVIGDERQEVRDIVSALEFHAGAGPAAASASASAADWLTSSAITS